MFRSGDHDRCEKRWKCLGHASSVYPHTTSVTCRDTRRALGRLLARGRLALRMRFDFGRARYRTDRSVSARFLGCGWSSSRERPTAQRRIRGGPSFGLQRGFNLSLERDGMKRYARNDRPLLSVHQNASIGQCGCLDLGSSTRRTRRRQAPIPGL